MSDGAAGKTVGNRETLGWLRELLEKLIRNILWKVPVQVRS